MVAFSALSVGDKLYSVSSERMGNTTMRRAVVRQLTVTEIDNEARRAKLTGSVAGPIWRSERLLRPYRRTPPTKD
jgi:hypothetical protein